MTKKHRVRWGIKISFQAKFDGLFYSVLYVILPPFLYAWANRTNMGNVFPITGEGNGTPLQYSCLENPMDGGAGKVAVHRVAKSRTRLKRPSITAIFGFCDCFLICKSFESEATSPQEPFYPMDLCFFCLFVYICQSIYLFGFTGC